MSEDRRIRGNSAFAASLIALVVVGCAPSRRPAVATSSVETGPRGVGVVRSNIERADYAGSAACERCHAEISANWRRSSMHNMTRVPVEDSARVLVHAPFGERGDRTEFRFKNDRAITETHEGRRYVRILSPEFGDHLFRVTRIIGGHHREDFAGVEVSGIGAPGTTTGATVGDPHEEHILPLSYLIASKRFRYKGYSVMTPERPGLKPGAVWNRTCLFCHNTVPLLSTYLGTLAGPRASAYQGEMVDALLPGERRAPLEILDEGALRGAIEREVAALAARQPLPPDLTSALGEAVKVTRARFDGEHLVEVGIGCESCHGGSREHVAHNGVLPSYAPRSPFLRQRLPAVAITVAGAAKAVGPNLRKSTAAIATSIAPNSDEEPTPDERSRQINRVCARCHQVLFTQYPWTWEGEARRSAHPGGAHINSGEARDFLLGGCASQMSCIACHDPHSPDNTAKLRALEGPAGDAICLGCHKKYEGAEATRAHTHHLPEGAGSRCIACHMPKKNLTLDSRLGLYHRIGSPTVTEKVEKDRPLECALCHADKSVGALVGDMERLWGKRYDRAALQKLYGGLDENVMRATLRQGKPHEQAVALFVLGEARARDATTLIAAQLTNGYPLVRYYAESALEKILGTPSPVDVHSENAKIRAVADAWLEAR